MIICQRLLNSRETDVTQIRCNTWIERSTLSLLIVALLHINQRMLTCSTGQNILGKMIDHKVSDFVTKKSYHTETLVSKYLIKATSYTVSVDPLLLFQQLITVEYRCG